MIGSGLAGEPAAIGLMARQDFAAGGDIGRAAATAVVQRPSSCLLGRRDPDVREFR
jgi:hypothetical protein